MENAALIANRYNSTTHKPPGHTQKHPNGYLVPLLKKFLNKKINYKDPETEKTIRGKVKDAVVWRYILNATQGENQAIEGIFDRTDGKLKANGSDKDTHFHFHFTTEERNSKLDWLSNFAASRQNNR